MQYGRDEQCSRSSHGQSDFVSVLAITENILSTKVVS